MADRYDDGFQAQVDGQKVTVINDQGMRKIELPPGVHQVEFNYQPQLLYFGGLISLVSLLLGLVWLKFNQRD